MRKLLLFFFVCISIFAVSAQGNIIETVYLKNGSIVKGMIVEIVPNVSCTVKTADGSIFVCNMADIVKITREIPAETSSAASGGTGLKQKPMDKGYEGVVELGYGAKTGKYGLDIVKLNIINGYRINQKFFVGAGTGLRILPESETTMIPVFADFRASFMPKPVTPYASFSAGMSFNTAYGFKDAGWMFHPEVGVQFNKTKEMLFHISVGYDVQQMKFVTFDVFNPGLISGTKMRFSESANINFGITF